MSTIVTVSSKGQITIPVSERKKHAYKKYMLDSDGVNLILRPVEIKVVENKVSQKEERVFDKNFHHLAAASFDFLDNQEDDKWNDFYNDLPDISK